MCLGSRSATLGQQPERKQGSHSKVLNSDNNLNELGRGPQAIQEKALISAA
jgi:hypothetical protein